MGALSRSGRFSFGRSSIVEADCGAALAGGEGARKLGAGIVTDSARATSDSSLDDSDSTRTTSDTCSGPSDRCNVVSAPVLSSVRSPAGSAQSRSDGGVSPSGTFFTTEYAPWFTCLGPGASRAPAGSSRAIPSRLAPARLLRGNRRQGIRLLRRAAIRRTARGSGATAREPRRH